MSASPSWSERGAVRPPRPQAVCPPVDLRAWSAEEFLARRFAPKDPLVTDLLHARDLVALGARRRHGKTSLCTNLAVALAEPAPDWVGYEIPQARRSLLLILEDDPGEYQEKLRRVIADRDTRGRIRVMCRDDFYEAGIPIDVHDSDFRDAVYNRAGEHRPDLIVIDNLAHVIDADYSEPKRVHELMTFTYRLARDHNCAIILAAHPRKEDDHHPVSLREAPGRFFEAIMGSSHFINSTGSLWGLERPEGVEYSVFVGGRQRSEGHQGHSFIEMDDHGWFRVVPGAEVNLPLVLNTHARREAWKLLPGPPATFGYREGETLVRPAMRSSSTYSHWVGDCKRLGVILAAPDGKLKKAVAA